MEIIMTKLSDLERSNFNRVVSLVPITCLYFNVHIYIIRSIVMFPRNKAPGLVLNYTNLGEILSLRVRFQFQANVYPTVFPDGQLYIYNVIHHDVFKCSVFQDPQIGSSPLQCLL